MTAFIFDMDGTLVDNMQVHMDIWVQILAEQGVQTTKGEFYRRSAGKTNSEIFHDYLEISDEKAATLEEKKEALYRRIFAPSLKAVDGLEEFLGRARRLGIRMAVATSAPPANVHFVLDGLKIKPYFGAVVDATQVKNGKPHPEMFLTAARRLEVSPESCIVFEDAPSGILAARRAGMKVVVITTTLKPEELDGDEMILHAARDFTSLTPEQLRGA